MQGPGLDQNVENFEKGAGPNYFSFEIQSRGAGHPHFINEYEDLFWGMERGGNVIPGIYVRWAVSSVNSILSSVDTLATSNKLFNKCDVLNSLHLLTIGILE